MQVLQRKGIQRLCSDCLHVVVQFICQISDMEYLGTESAVQLASLCESASVNFELRRNTDSR